MARPRPGTRGPRAGGGWVVVGVVAFVIVDIALVWFAFASTSSAAAGAATPEVVPTFAPRLAPTSTPSAAIPAAEPDVIVEPLTVVLGAADAAVAFRAVTGSCPATPAALEITRDGGATWAPTAPAEASSIRDVFVDGPDAVSVIAGRLDGCSPVLLRTFVQGDAWQATEELTTRWHIAGGGVIAPGGAASTPCAEPVQMAAREPERAAVLCADATVAVTTDAGAGWATTAPLDGAVSVAATADAFLVAVGGREGCAGVQVVPLSPALEAGAPGGCLASDAADGATVLATAGDGTVWVWSGDVVARSADGGTTW